MENKQRGLFIEALEDNYGSFKKDSALFGSTNYSEISKALCYSNSHFTKLMSGGATEAMYERAIENVRRLNKHKTLTHSFESSKSSFTSTLKFYKYGFLLAIGICSITLVSFLTSKAESKEPIDLESHPLEMYFNFNNNNYYKSPYLTEEQVNTFCPASAFEGKWALDNKYIIPIPYKIPGLYYVGKSADIRLKCKKSSLPNDKGKELIGFENIENEIWFDKTMQPIDIDEFKTQENSLYRKFENTKDLIKIASVYSCFFDEILISKDSIYRKGEPCGRYANTHNEEVIAEYKLDLDHIIEYIIGNMVFAQCDALENKFCDPNKLQNGISTLDFSCKCSFKTGSAGFGSSYPYIKSIKLIEQNYQSSLRCNCD